jgi:tartrate dehydratase beta subunit/fumarate hydratase class I family protein
MSAASIDRYLKPAKATDQLRGKSTTKPSPLLRSSIKIRKAGDEVEAEPGFFEGDTVAHCGPTLKGEFARTLNLTDVHTGWVFTRTVRNNAHTHILGALKAGVEEVPFAVTGLDFDYADPVTLSRMALPGGESALIGWHNPGARADASFIGNRRRRSS